ncbi:MAG: BON domain-containing protein [Acetobacteraceae bacterium]|nr:BON domain-containing protein [Pseudomonadota bacterium]
MDDRTLQHAVAEELEWAPHVDASGINVTVHDGVVRLSGFVGTLAEKKAANRNVWHLHGVVGVRDELVVSPPAAHRHTDAELASRAAQLLLWDSLIPGHAIAVHCEGGTITLSGMLDEPHLRAEAEQRVQLLAGVVGIDNRITIRPKHDLASDVRDKVLRALARHSELDSSGITVSVADKQVTLGGTVPSFVQRRIAETAAWAAPGVNDVIDHMHVVRPSGGAKSGA